MNYLTAAENGEMDSLLGNRLCMLWKYERVGSSRCLHNQLYHPMDPPNGSSKAEDDL
jgi:hypothetical protein